MPDAQKGIRKAKWQTLALTAWAFGVCHSLLPLSIRHFAFCIFYRSRGASATSAKCLMHKRPAKSEMASRGAPGLAI
jgi:hypothetical protein